MIYYNYQDNVINNQKISKMHKKTIENLYYNKVLSKIVTLNTYNYNKIIKKNFNNLYNN